MSNEDATPCMGGWCTMRDRCPNYRSDRILSEPAERLCPKGIDGIVPGLRTEPVMVRTRNGLQEVFA